MIKSMTGFGAARLENERLVVNVEIKSLNSKFNDLGLKLPHAFSSKEIEARNILSERLLRGKINAIISYSSKQSTVKLQLNESVIAEYYQTLKGLADSLNASEQDIFRMVMAMPDAYSSDTDVDALEEDWSAVRDTLIKACIACDGFRMQEGVALEKELVAYTERIRTLLDQIEVYDPRRVERVRERLHQQVAELISNDNFDPNRFEQELIFYIEKLDISEEKVRLRNHISFFLETIHGSEANGKKLGFISQEMGREINTIGSKANDSDIQKLVIAMKEELEKIKEQSLNVL